MHVLNWPKTRPLTDASGDPESAGRWAAVVSPGRLELHPPADGALDGPLVFTDAAELRAFAMQVYAAALDQEGAAREAAAKASLARRRGGLRHRPFVEPPEPPLHMEVPA